MKLTRASFYALNALVHLAEQGEGKPLASHQAAKARAIPERFLLKVLKPLVDAGILRSVKGPNGGYVLLKPANKITLLEVIEAVDGPIAGTAPLLEGTADGAALDRRLQAIAERAADDARKQLRGVTLANLVGKGK